MVDLACSVILSQNQNLVKCSCGNVMDVVQGQVDLSMKDD